MHRWKRGTTSLGLIVSALLLLWVSALPVLSEEAVTVKVRATLPLGIVHLLQSMAGEPGFLPGAVEEIQKHRDFNAQEGSVLKAVIDRLQSETGQRDESLARTLRESALLHDTVESFLGDLESRIAPSAISGPNYASSKRTTCRRSERSPF